MSKWYVITILPAPQPRHPIIQEIDPNTPAQERATMVSRALGGVTIVEKGAVDIICTNTGSASVEDARLSKVNASLLRRACGDNVECPFIQVSPGESTEEQVIVDVEGGLKRCGGQGDVLSGSIGTVLAWGKCYEDGAFGYVSFFVSRFL